MKFLNLLSILTVSILFIGCFAKQNGVPNGLFFTDSSVLIQKDSSQATRKGKECASSILGYFAAGDLSVEKIAQKTNIKTVTGVSHTAIGALGIFQEYCVVVEGN